MNSINKEIIDFENIDTYPLDLIKILEKHKGDMIINGKINEPNNQLKIEVENILRNKQFYCYHFTRTLNVDDYYKYGILKNSDPILDEIFLKNMKANLSEDNYLNFLEVLNTEREKQLKEKEKYNIEIGDFVYFSFNYNKIVKSDNGLQGSLLKIYGGEFLCNSGFNINLLKKGKPICIKFILDYYEELKFNLIPQLIKNYYAIKYFKDFSYGTDGKVMNNVESNKIKDIIFLNDNELPDFLY